MLSTPIPHHNEQRAIMSARSSDWRSGANPSGVALDAFSDVLRPSLSLSLSHSLSLSLTLSLSLLAEFRVSVLVTPSPTTRVLHNAPDVLPSSLSLSLSPGRLSPPHSSANLRVLTANTPINTTLPAASGCSRDCWEG